MNKIFRRFVAYTIDMMVVTLVVQSLFGIPQINKQLNNYNKYYNEYMKEYKEYAEFSIDLKDYYEDKKLTAKEYTKLVDKHDKYKNTVDKYYKDNKLSKKNYEKLNKEVSEEYNDVYQDIYYKIEKNSILYFALYLVVVFAYFVGFNKYTGGQTLGKKLMKLRIINAKDEAKGVSTFSYVIRALVLYQPVLYIVKLIGINFMSHGTYFDVTNIVYQIQYYIELAVIACAMIRLDGRGVHDLLAGTRVMRYDRNGNEVEDKLNQAMMDAKDEMSKKQETKENDISSDDEDDDILEEDKPEVIKENKKKTTSKKTQGKRKNTSKKKIIEEPKE